jgi:hypothetical protein
MMSYTESIHFHFLIFTYVHELMYYTNNNSIFNKYLNRCNVEFARATLNLLALYLMPFFLFRLGL